MNMVLDRRRFVKLVGMSSVAVGHAAMFGASMQMLKELGAGCGIPLIGVQVNLAWLPNMAFADFVAENCTILTPGYQLKWATVRPQVDRFDFSKADYTFDFVRKHKLAIHGHNLCWNTANPDWLKGYITPKNGRQLLEDHIHHVAGRYKGEIESWDAVNEPIAVWQNRPDNLREGPWLKALGEEYIDIAFGALRATDDKALRVLNLNGNERQTGLGDQTRVASLNLIKRLLKRGVPVQAVGLESHVDAPWKPGTTAHKDFIHAVRDLGLEVLITEMDVNDTALQGGADSVKAQVQQCYHDYLLETITAARPKRLIFWSVSDNNNWYDEEAKTQVEFKRADQRPHTTGLLDSAFMPNPALNGVQQALLAAGRQKAG